MPLSDIEKTAVLLIALGPERAGRILDRLGTADLLPIIEAMKHMRRIDPETRRAVLEEVAELLEDLAAGKTPRSHRAIDLFKTLGPYLPEPIDPKHIDWDRAGFNFDPPDEAPPDLPGCRR